MTKCNQTRTKELTDKGVRASIRYQESLPAGSWSKGKLEDHLLRPRKTINQWDRLLVSLLPDYEKFWQGAYKPLTDYHRWCLEAVSKFQNRQQPWRAVEDVENYIKRNADKLTLSEYMKQFTGA
jgi:hypothetical protein